MTKAALYARLSQDRDGTSTGTDRQLADARAMAQARGWTIAGEYVDRDLSAYSNVQRPQYERMLADLEAGEIDLILSWKLDRLMRRPREFERLWALCEPREAHIATVRDGIDTSAPFVGTLLPRLMSIFAEMESQSISVRAQSKAAEIAKLGRHHGGGSRAFGLSADWSKVKADEAELVHEGADRVLAGETLRGVAMDWNARGIRTPKGGEWRPETLRQMLVSPRIAGLREHKGAIAGRDGFPAILDESIWQRLAATLRHRNGSRGPQARRHLLSGILACSACDGRMNGHRGMDKVLRYICPPKPRGCGRIKVMADPLEELVTEMLFVRLDSPELATAIQTTAQQDRSTADLEQVRTDEAALEELARDYYTDRRITRAEYLAARSGLETRLGAARRSLARRNGNGVLANLLAAGDAARTAWRDGSLEWRRAVLLALFDRIEILPAVRGRNRFDSERVRPVWRF